MSEGAGGAPSGDPIVRLGVRFPSMTRAAVRVLVAVPRSRLRTRLWRWAMDVGFSTSDRREWTFLRTYMHPAVRIDLRHAGGWALDLEREYRGPEGYISWFEAFSGVFSEWDTGTLEVVAPPGNRILVISHPSGRGRGSGIEVTGELWTVFTYERGWLIRIENFADSDEALASVGLRRR